MHDYLFSCLIICIMIIFVFLFYIICIIFVIFYFIYLHLLTIFLYLCQIFLSFITCVIQNLCKKTHKPSHNSKTKTINALPSLTLHCKPKRRWTSVLWSLQFGHPVTFGRYCVCDWLRRKTLAGVSLASVSLQTMSLCLRRKDSV